MNWKPIETAPTDRVILIWGDEWDFDFDDNKCCVAFAAVCYYEDNVWLVAYSGYSTTQCLNPLYWAEITPPTIEGNEK